MNETLNETLRHMEEHNLSISRVITVGKLSAIEFKEEEDAGRIEKYY